MAYLELPRAQHAFDVLASIRCRHTTLGVVRFLEGVRARVDPLSRRAAGRQRGRAGAGSDPAGVADPAAAGHAAEFLT